MNSDSVIELVRQSLWVGAKVSLPILLVVLAVGLFIGVLQSVTQLQEPTLTFVPKLIATAAVILLAGNWMLNELVTFTQVMIRNSPNLIGG
jgi:flagellar biosynthetic protein FliQ